MNTKLFKDKNPKADRVIGVALVYCLILFLVYGFIAGPISIYSANLKKELQFRDQKIKEYEGLIRIYPNPDQEIKNIEKRIEEIANKSANREQIPRIIQQLAQKTNELDINTISIKPRDEIELSDDKSIKGVNKVYIEIVMLSPYRIVGDYLKALTELPIILTVESITIEKRPVDLISAIPSRGNELLVTLILSAYMVIEI